MLRITIPPFEAYDERAGEFITFEGQTLDMEHSLVSLSKWESKWCRPFLSKATMTDEETMDYIRCMTITPDVDPTTYNYLTNDNIREIQDYIAAPMTATTFVEDKGGKGNKEVVTNELVYYWMFSLQIPKDCENWHLNRLLTLIRVFSIKNQPPKKMGKKQLMNRYAELNAARRKQLNSSG